MTKKKILIAGLFALGLNGIAYAAGETSSGTLSVTATVNGSINLTFVTDGSGVALTGTGTATATLPYGTIQMYAGTVPANVTRTLNGVTSFAVATPFDVRVDKANTASANYTLDATLTSADVTNTWLVNAVDVSDAASHTITATGAYGSAASHTMKVTIPATNNTGSLSNSISFAATAN